MFIQGIHSTKTDSHHAVCYADVNTLKPGQTDHNFADSMKDIFSKESLAVIINILMKYIFVKLEELHIATTRKPLINQNQSVAQYLQKIQPCML